jgi:hypothetical protein
MHESFLGNQFRLFNWNMLGFPTAQGQPERRSPRVRVQRDSFKFTPLPGAEKTRRPLRRNPQPSPAPVPLPTPRPAETARRSTGRLTGTLVKDGNRIPDAFGKATTFWNGAYTYKGRRDRDNMSKGAWGDLNKPTDYFCALPVGLRGGGKWWHNQKILVTNPRTGEQVVVRVQDKGPGPRTGAKIDLSPVAKEALGVGFMENLNVNIAFAPDDAPVGPVR